MQTYHLRMLGLALGMFPVDRHLLRAACSGLAMGAFAGPMALLWPQPPYLLARRAGSPAHAEVRSILVDAGMAGVWLTLIHFNTPAGPEYPDGHGRDARLLGRLAVDGAWAVGTGYRMPGGGFLSRASNGCRTPMTSWPLATIPLLVVYPVAVSAATYRLARRVSNQNRLLSQMSRTDGLT